MLPAGAPNKPAIQRVADRLVALASAINRFRLQRGQRMDLVDMSKIGAQLEAGMSIAKAQDNEVAQQLLLEAKRLLMNELGADGAARVKQAADAIRSAKPAHRRRGKGPPVPKAAKIHVMEAKLHLSRGDKQLAARSLSQAHQAGASLNSLEAAGFRMSVLPRPDVVSADAHARNFGYHILRFGAQTQTNGHQRVRFAGARAPKGGVSIAGKQYIGGQFIPGEELAKASPEEKAKIAGEGSGGSGSQKGGSASSVRQSKRTSRSLGVLQRAVLNDNISKADFDKLIDPAIKAASDAGLTDTAQELAKSKAQFNDVQMKRVVKSNIIHRLRNAGEDFEFHAEELEAGGTTAQPAAQPAAQPTKSKPAKVGQFTIPMGRWNGKASPKELRESFFRKVGVSGLSGRRGSDGSLKLKGEKIRTLGSDILGRGSLGLVGSKNLKDAAMAYVKSRRFKRTASRRFHGKTESTYEDEHGNKVTFRPGVSKGETWVIFGKK